jgi:hypothetical protein
MLLSPGREVIAKFSQIFFTARLYYNFSLGMP